MKISIGRIVEFLPNGVKGMELPNGMESAPALVTQTFDSDMVNMIVFVADPLPTNTGTFRAWSVHHKSNAVEGQPYWDWFPQVTE